jgi:hypothetical protein
MIKCEILIIAVQQLKDIFNIVGMNLHAWLNIYPTRVSIEIVAHVLWKNALLGQKKIKLWNEWHFVENKTEIMQHVLKMQ